MNIAILLVIKLTNRPIGYWRVYLPLCKMADTSFNIQGDKIKTVFDVMLEHPCVLAKETNYCTLYNSTISQCCFSVGPPCDSGPTVKQL